VTLPTEDDETYQNFNVDVVVKELTAMIGSDEYLERVAKDLIIFLDGFSGKAPPQAIEILKKKQNV